MKPRPRNKLSKSEQMARVRTYDTKPEATFEAGLQRLGIPYDRRSTLPGSPDFTFPQARIAVFIDGCFWHGCPAHYTLPVENAAFWERKLQQNRARDQDVDDRLRNMGWEVIRIWSHDTKAGTLQAALNRVVSEIERRRD